MISVVNDKLSITVKDGVPKIISPFDISAEMRQYSSVFDRLNAPKDKEREITYGMSGRVEMMPMVMRFGYSDFDILMSSLSAISPPKLEEDQSYVASPRAPASPLVGLDEQKTMEEGGDTASESSFSEEGRQALPSEKQQEMEARLAEQQEKAKNAELPDQGEMEFAFRISEISLELVNDKVPRAEVPLAKFLVNKVGADLYSYKQRLAIHTQFQLKGDYWNNQVLYTLPTAA